MLEHLSRTIFLFGLLLIGACDKIYMPLEKKEVEEEKPIARVKEIYLYESDVLGLAINLSGEDSAKIVNMYVDSWVNKQLNIARAAKEIKFNEADIERKVLDYKYALMIHEFEKYYIDQHLDKEISEQEIQNYYVDKSDNFILRQNIIRCLFAVVPVEAPQVDLFRNQIRSYPKSDLEEIKSYCYRFATQSALDTEMWLSLDEVITNSPLMNVQDKVAFLKSNSYIETSDEVNYYFIRLLDYKVSNQVSPLEFIKDDIVSILINKKKVDLRRQLEEDILKEAKKNNEFEIY